jgi:membrane protease YdiL (CAAX protease family)
MNSKPPLSKKRKTTRWVLVVFMGIVTILETILAINLTAAEGCGAIGAGILLLFSIPITVVLLIILLIFWILLGIRRVKDEPVTDEQLTDVKKLDTT